MYRPGDTLTEDKVPIEIDIHGYQYKSELTVPIEIDIHDYQ